MIENRHIAPPAEQPAHAAWEGDRDPSEFGVVIPEEGKKR
jgi:hypothetical protein